MTDANSPIPPAVQSTQEQPDQPPMLTLALRIPSADLRALKLNPEQAELLRLHRDISSRAIGAVQEFLTTWHPPAPTIEAGMTVRQLGAGDTTAVVEYITATGEYALCDIGQDRYRLVEVGSLTPVTGPAMEPKPVAIADLAQGGIVTRPQIPNRPG